ncbi:MAG: hypothetical protein NTZ68_00105 [Candidatus Dependentiae bacterium]|nr:hypothetical protein [Candidatus Dependentiae bacterium]
MNYNFKIFTLSLLAASPIFCPPNERPQAARPNSIQRPTIPDRPILGQLSQVLQPVAQRKVTIFDAGFVEQTSNKSTVSFRNFPEITLSCITRATFRSITFEANENGRDMPITVHESTQLEEIDDNDTAYNQNPTIVLDRYEHPINPPYLQSTSCTFSWPNLNIRHIFFVYRKQRSLYVHYVLDNLDEPSPPRFRPR